jgi:biofilm PGA synthesis N-glycosyltransferase PgaC
MATIFWFSFLGLLFVYFGYGVVVFVLNKLSRKSTQPVSISENELPEVAVLIAAYNEEEIIEQKINNTLLLNYPEDKLKVYVVADGSNDNTCAMAEKFEQVKVLYRRERKGKSAAINRAVPLLHEPIVFFTDANVMLCADAVRLIVNRYADEKVGGVSGEKVVMSDARAGAASAEGAYWKYESWLKKEDAKLYSLVGAAGELFSIRTKLFKPVEEDTLLDDFMISMDIVRQGYKIDYEPKAFASETPSFNIEEEQVRKVRIAAGGIQSIIRNADLCNPFVYGIVSLQFLIHRVSRWTVTPVMIVTAFISNLFLLNEGTLYSVLFALQLLFHTAASIGYYLNSRQIKVRALHIPFYFDFMHYCVVLGWFRYANGKQKATWQKATRLSYN